MEIMLTPSEARVLGALIEKEITTPEYYPLTLNSLTAACNQKSSRDPVMTLSQADVMNAIFELRHKKLVVEKREADARVPKYEHILLDMFDFPEEELAALCVLMLRGPQTPGEVRAKSGRLFEYSSVEQAEAALDRLASREDGPFVVKLPRQSGRREARYAHLFFGSVLPEEWSVEAESGEPRTGPTSSDRIRLLETRIEALESELASFRTEFATFRKLVE
jgi:uncharacterized protein YceH (UPF0502 family)